jgi:hypothetical protein
MQQQLQARFRHRCSIQSRRRWDSNLRRTGSTAREGLKSKSSSSSSSSSKRRRYRSRTFSNDTRFTARRSDGRTTRWVTNLEDEDDDENEDEKRLWSPRGGVTLTLVTTSPKPAKECAKICGQELRFFCGREMAAARHFGPMLQVIPALDPDPRRKRQFFRKMGDARGHVDKFPCSELQRHFSALGIQAERRVNRLRHPVECYIR